MIDELTAQQYVDTIDSVSGAERDRMSRELLSYADEVESLEKEQANAHFEKLYTDPTYLSEVAKDPLVVEAEKHALSPNDVRYGVANRAYLSNLAGREITGPEYELQRDSYAKATFDKPKVGEKEFFDLVKGQFETKQQRTVAVNDLYTSAVKQALEDELEGKSTSTVDLFQKWKEKNAEIVTADDELGFFTNSRRIIERAKSDIKGAAPAAARIWQGLTKYTQGEASEQEVYQIGAELASMPYEERQKVYKYVKMAAQAGDGTSEDIEQAAKNLGQSISRGFMETPFEMKNVGGILPMSMPTLKYTPLWMIEKQAQVGLMRLERQPDSPEKTAEIARLNQQMEMTQVVRELKNLAEEGVDPIKPIFPEGGLLSPGTVERGIYGLGGSLGFMAETAINPMLGLSAIYGDEYNKMRLENPKMNPHAAGAAALASAGIQTALEMMQIRGLRGLPLTSALIKDMPRSLARKAAAIGIEVGEQNAIEAMQDATSQAIPAIMSTLREDMPDKDIGKEFQSFLTQRKEVFWATLPLALIGGGFASVKDFRAQEVLDDRMLTYFGFNAQQKKDILTSPNPDAVIRREAANISETKLQQGIAAVKEDYANVEAAQADPTRPTLESTLLPTGEREYTITRMPKQAVTADVGYLGPKELQGKTVNITSVDAETGVVQQVQMSAEAGQALAKRNIENYTTLVDCLTR